MFKPLYATEEVNSNSINSVLSPKRQNKIIDTQTKKYCNTHISSLFHYWFSMTLEELKEAQKYYEYDYNIIVNVIVLKPF